MFALGVTVISLLSYAQAQDPNCDYVIYVSKGKTYPISSPNYPNNYNQGVSCRWIGVCEEGYNCKVDCELNLPQSSSCSMDRVFVSKTGDSTLSSANYYCGRGSISAVSTGTQISLGLFLNNTKIVTETSDSSNYTCSEIMKDCDWLWRDKESRHLPIRNALVTSRNSSGGKFRCDLSAQPASTPTCNCGYKKKNRIVGGEETQPNEYPMMAGVVYVGENNIKCGAVIIDNSYVLTAAHCVANKTLNQIAVVVGEHDVSRGADSPDLQVFKVVAIKSHNQYNPDTLDYDIAIIRLNGMIVYSDNVGPACLPFKFANSDFTGASVTILGWGTTTPGGPTSRVLREADVQVISQASCSRSISTVTSRQMCTFTQGKDACQDDSGGPLLYQDASNGRLYNVGVVSFGRFCASTYPGVNTRITSFLDWIVTNAPANYCRI